MTVDAQIRRVITALVLFLALVVIGVGTPTVASARDHAREEMEFDYKVTIPVLEGMMVMYTNKEHSAYDRLTSVYFAYYTVAVCHAKSQRGRLAVLATDEELALAKTTTAAKELALSKEVKIDESDRTRAWERMNQVAVLGAPLALEQRPEHFLRELCRIAIPHATTNRLQRLEIKKDF